MTGMTVTNQKYIHKDINSILNFKKTLKLKYKNNNQGG
jgi:hypothetical protein